MPPHGIEVALRFVVVTVGKGRLGHKGAEPSIVSGVGEMRELLVGDDEFRPQLLQSLPHLDELALEHRPGHRADHSTYRGGPDHLIDCAHGSPRLRLRSAASARWRSLAAFCCGPGAA